MTSQDYAKRWDAMTPVQRGQALKRAMPSPTWAALRDRMSVTAYADLTSIQQDAMSEILT